MVTQFNQHMTLYAYQRGRRGMFLYIVYIWPDMLSPGAQISSCPEMELLFADKEVK